ncbi:hypothetical protein A2303_03100 [Candidatus Falkowbacteria bacterium RIFOXYB2_FULL_47_14]|uniref:Phosphoribosyltransferase domain-containing protein n=1 Tax=Candidatus Falkowbacteria bacterium RIFOXYA2_FULL_47_19 TaxID=1797994 RepID=A0A1F5SF08_9BACT|nr:MAG: hypothetical protein A2227_07875 [Candidatus Falkowbacteria bacterium RIFOXYA2_FULL_47_19]OGF35176.1 MAG: hypothetical protein A2468_01935 [Candidatus Falkowbacteria bacterium RIFOXYC2_FULL_46_15]OGF43341.1 MAG: hypothetical protein A2303_03100 [Candidatus Falkowbacteria bacterium RIFOXYB2_FULL_47_14]
MSERKFAQLISPREHVRQDLEDSDISKPEDWRDAAGIYEQELDEFQGENMEDLIRYETLVQHEPALIKAKVKEALASIKKNRIDACVFLDKAARSLSWVLSRVAKRVLDDKSVPLMKYINIGSEKRGGRSVKKIVEELKNTPDFLRLKEQWRDLRGKNIMIVDDIKNTGESLKLAETAVGEILETEKIKIFFFDEIDDDDESEDFRAGFSWRPGSMNAMGALFSEKREPSANGRTGVTDEKYGDNNNLLARPNTEERLKSQVPLYMEDLAEWLNHSDDALEMRGDILEALQEMEKLSDLEKYQEKFDAALHDCGKDDYSPKQSAARNKNEELVRKLLAAKKLAKEYSGKIFPLNDLVRRIRQNMEIFPDKIRKGGIKTEEEMRAAREEATKIIEEYEAVVFVLKEISVQWCRSLITARKQGQAIEPDDYDLFHDDYQSISECVSAYRNLYISLKEDMDSFLKMIEDIRANRDYAKALRRDMDHLAGQIIKEIEAVKK